MLYKQGRCNEGFNAEPIAFAFCISNLNFPPKIRNFSDFGSGKNFMIGRKFWVWVKNLCSGENFGFGGKFWVWVKILGSGQNFGFERKSLVRVKILHSGENFRFG